MTIIETAKLSDLNPEAYLADVLASQWEPRPRIIPDELETLQETLVELSDGEQCCLIVTTGGTDESTLLDGFTTHQPSVVKASVR